MLKTVGIIAASVALTATAGVGGSAAHTKPTGDDVVPSATSAPASHGNQSRPGDWIIPPEPTCRSGRSCRHRLLSTHQPVEVNR